MATAESALRRRTSIALALGALSCGPPPTPAALIHAPEPEAKAESHATERFGLVEIARLPGIVALYDPDHWRSENGGSFTLLEHPATRSTLAVRVWRAARLVRPDECEAEARLARPTLPRREPDSIVDTRPLEAPRDFAGSLVVGVEPTPGGGARGFALAVGAAVGRCYVLAFETIAEGAHAAADVGDRLRLAADRIVPSVVLSAVDERVRPERELK